MTKKVFHLKHILIGLSVFYLLFFALAMLIGIRIHHIQPILSLTDDVVKLIITMIGLLLAAYLVSLQYFRNRYPLNFIITQLQGRFTEVILISTSCLLIGKILSISHVDLALVYIGYLIHFILLCTYLISFYKKIVTFDIYSILEKKKSTLINNIKATNDDVPFSVNTLKAELYNLNQYFKDSVYNKEISICRHVVDIQSDVLFEFLIHKDQLIMKHNLNDTEFERTIIDTLFKNMRLCQERSEGSLIEYSLTKVTNLGKKLVKYTKNSFLKYILKKIKDFVMYCAEMELKNACISAIRSVYVIYHYSITNEDLEAQSLVGDCCTEMFLYSDLERYDFISEEIIISTFRVVYINFDKLNREKVKLLIDELFAYIKSYISNNPGKTRNDVILFGLYNLTESKNMNNAQIDVLLDNIIAVAKLAIRNHNRNLGMISLNVLEKFAYNLKERSDKVYDAMCDMIGFALHFDAPYTFAFWPQLDRVGYHYQPKLVEKIKHPIIYSITNKNTPGLVYFVNMLQNLLKELPVSHGLAQERAIEIFGEALGYSSQYKSDEMFHIIVSKLKDTLKMLNDKNRISESMVRCVLRMFNNIGRSINRPDYIEELARLTHYLAKELNIFYKKSKLMLEYIEFLFDIGIHGIENEDLKLIRVASNFLGWTNYNAIKENNQNVFKDSLEKITSLYNHCALFNVSDNTVVFVGTSFIVLGASCVSLNKQFLNQIRVSISTLERKELLSKSKILRELQNKCWDDVIGENAVASIRAFYSQIESDLQIASN